MKNLSSHFLRALGRLNFRAWKILTKCLDVSIRASAWVLVRVLCVAVPVGVLIAIISASSHCYLYFENLAVKEARAAYVQGVDYLAREHGYVVPVSVRASEPLTIEGILKREMVINDIPSGMFGVLRALIKHESNDKPHAVSKANCIGLMQINPSNLSFCGLEIVDLYNPEKNIACGLRIYKAGLVRQRGDLIRSLKDYNSGPSRIDATQENREYVQKVFKELVRLEVQDEEI